MQPFTGGLEKSSEKSQSLTETNQKPFRSNERKKKRDKVKERFELSFWLETRPQGP